MKKVIVFILIALTLVSVLASCKNAKDGPKGAEDKYSVVCTIFPEYDWLYNVIGTHTDDIELKMLIKSGVDLHNFQPSADDIICISKCDMFVYVGGESDNWVDDVLETANNPDMIVINLMDVLSGYTKEEEVKEGMQGEEEDDEGEECPEYDEHVWLSLQNAVKVCEFLRDKLTEMDKHGEADFAANCEAYVEKAERA